MAGLIVPFNFDEPLLFLFTLCLYVFYGNHININGLYILTQSLEILVDNSVCWAFTPLSMSALESSGTELNQLNNIKHSISPSLCLLMEDCTF